MTSIPADWEVQPLSAIDSVITGVIRTTCGTCGLSWDDSISTSMTPVPSGRCPFEPFHPDEDEREFTIKRRAERRGIPRRKDEVVMHYATQNLLAAALSFVESEPISTGARTADLYGAVALYRLAEKEAR